MSKNIIIQEGGTAKQMTVNKLKTDAVGGGTCLWVPEDETALTRKKITEGGTYKASDEGYYGYSEVEVNVKGGNGSADSSGKPVATFDSDGNYENAPGGIGSAVVGIDPDSGEWVAVGVDSNGNLVRTQIPAEISIITPPTKTSYTDGETINYSGIVVGLKTKSGSTFTNATYPNGHIPAQELIFSVSTADKSGSSGSGGKTSQLVTNLQQPIFVSSGNFFTSAGFEVAPSYPYILVNDPNSFYFGSVIHILLPHGTPFNGVKFRRSETSAWETSGYSGRGSITYDEKTVDVYAVNFWGNISDAPYTSVVPDMNSCWTAMYGDIYEATQDIPVQWRSPYDGNTYEDSFEITVTDNGDSGTNDGGGYSDDSGGSSSGGGGGF